MLCPGGRMSCAIGCNGAAFRAILPLPLLPPAATPHRGPGATARPASTRPSRDPPHARHCLGRRGPAATPFIPGFTFAGAARALLRIPAALPGPARGGPGAATGADVDRVGHRRFPGRWRRPTSDRPQRLYTSI